MCYHAETPEDYKKMSERYARKLSAGTLSEDKVNEIMGEKNGFEQPLMPVITKAQPEYFQVYRWGLLPSWVNDPEFGRNTLNAKIETIRDKPSFRKYADQRCLIPVSSFTEWQSINSKGQPDPKGKLKRKYKICSEDHSIFSLGGICSVWVDKDTGEEIGTFAILTEPAKGLMAQIHNSKERMPFMLIQSEEDNWLMGGERTQLLPLDAIPVEKKGALF
jgi:putative SOS response-associated peptidase YedK